MTERRLDVLLVEDDPYDRKAVERMFSELEAGVNLKSVGSLEDARNYLDGNKVDVILLDLGLPDSGGIMTVQAITAAAPFTPVVVLTGGTDEDAVEAARMGAQGWTSKNELNGASFMRTLVQSIERQQELNALRRRYAAWTTVGRALRELGTSDLARRDPKGFHQVVSVYRSMLATVGERHRPAVLASQMKELARRFVEVDARVGDLLDVHLAAVGRRVEQESQSGRTREDEQLVIMEAMGHVMAELQRRYLELRAERPVREG